MYVTTSIEKSIRFAPVLYHYKDRKSLLKICKELFQLTLLNRSIPDYYFTRHLYRKEVTNIKDYLPNKLLYKASIALNDTSAADVLKNKLSFHYFYGTHIKQLPKLLMYNYQNLFYVGDKQIKINSPDNFESLLWEITSAKTSGQSLFVKKTSDSYGGRNIYRFTVADFPLEKNKLDEYYNRITSSSFLFQDFIVQHPRLNELNPCCINSIRMDTFIDKENQCDIISAFIRMSIDGSHVDNISSGGCYVGIDMNTGQLNEKGYSSITVAGGAILTAHPVTGLSFKGFMIPYFKEAKEMVLKAARLVPGLRLIGWDVAITDSGPMLIEGNCGYDITANDLAYGGYKANPVFRKVLQELKNDNKK